MIKSTIILMALLFLASCSSPQVAKDVQFIKTKTYELKILARDNLIKIYPIGVNPSEFDIEVLYHFRKKEKLTHSPYSSKRNVSIPLFIKDDHFEGKIGNGAKEFGLILSVTYLGDNNQFHAYFNNELE